MQGIHNILRYTCHNFCLFSTVYIHKSHVESTLNTFDQYILQGCLHGKWFTDSIGKKIMSASWVGINNQIQSFDLSFEGCINSVKRTIDDTYTYRFFDIPSNLQRIEFQFRIATDAHVVLSPHLTSRDVYEVVLGGWSNTKTVIRKCLQGCGKEKIETPYFLNSTEFRKFWITFNKENGTIELGVGNNHSPLLTWSDSDPLQINFIGYAKYHNIDAEFSLCNACK